MTAMLTAFRWVPPFAQGLVRDHRVRWALEEMGRPYEAVLVDQATLATPEFLGWQPFGQVPAFRDDEVEIFESGAIVLHLARGSEALAPQDAAGFARVSAWIFAALSTVEPAEQNFANLDSFHKDASWRDAYRPVAEAALRRRLRSLSAWLEGREHLEGRFTAADIMMSTVLRELTRSGILNDYPVLDAYLTRCQSRPAWKRALAAQLDTFQRNAPPDAS